VQQNSIRSFKVILKSKDEIFHIISTFNKTKKICPAIEISILRDRTLMERKQIRQTYAELKERKVGWRNGEMDIIIKYINGMPRIINLRQDFNKPLASKN